MRIILVLLFFGIVGSSKACVCFDIDSVSARGLIERAEFVIIGRAIENVGYDVEVNAMWDEQGRGFDVLFKVDSVLKGDVHAESIYVKQFGGNCDRVFEFGEQYLIIGRQLDKFVGITLEQGNLKEGEIPPPPPPSIYSKTVTFYDRNKKDIKYWNELAGESVIINTSACSSFSLTSGAAGYFLSIWQTTSVKAR